MSSHAHLPPGPSPVPTTTPWSSGSVQGRIATGALSPKGMLMEAPSPPSGARPRAARTRRSRMCAPSAGQLRASTSGSPGRRVHAARGISDERRGRACACSASAGRRRRVFGSETQSPGFDASTREPDSSADHRCLASGGSLPGGEASSGFSPCSWPRSAPGMSSRYGFRRRASDAHRTASPLRWAASCPVSLTTADQPTTV